MKRLLILTAALTAVVVLAACGSSGGNTGSAAPANAAPTVSTKQVDGVGTVLVNDKGLALYSPDEESNGQIKCAGACTSFWTPVAAGATTPTAAPGVAKLAVVRRPDGTMQVTAGGRPLYTFTQDSPGNVKGNGFTDDFNGQHLTWHAVMANGTAAATTPTTSGGAPAYGGY